MQSNQQSIQNSSLGAPQSQGAHYLPNSKDNQLNIQEQSKHKFDIHIQENNQNEKIRQNKTHEDTAKNSGQPLQQSLIKDFSTPSGYEPSSSDKRLNLIRSNDQKIQQKEKQQELRLEPLINESEPILPETIHEYKIIKKLEKGGFGIVFLGESQTKNIYAIKTFDCKTIQKQKKIGKQAKIMFSIEHPNILNVEYFFPYNKETSLAIVLQYCPDGDLSNFIGKLTQKEILEIQLQITKGLRYLHNKGIVHRDIKLENILMKNGKPKLADLGLAQIMKTSDQGNLIYDQLTGYAGTRSYMSPQVFYGGNYSKETDIWSLGIVMLELSTGKRIHKLTYDPISKKNLIPAQIQGFPNKEILGQIKDGQMIALVSGMLQRDPSKRTTLLEVDEKITQKQTQYHNEPQDDPILNSMNKLFEQFKQKSETISQQMSEIIQFIPFPQIK